MIRNSAEVVDLYRDDEWKCPRVGSQGGRYPPTEAEWRDTPRGEFSQFAVQMRPHVPMVRLGDGGD